MDVSHATSMRGLRGNLQAEGLYTDIMISVPAHCGWAQVWAAVMAAPLVDEALSSLLKAEQKAAKARRGPPGAEEAGRKRKRRREDSKDSDKDADSSQQVALLCALPILPSCFAQQGWNHAMRADQMAWTCPALGSLLLQHD